MLQDIAAKTIASALVRLFLLKPTFSLSFSRRLLDPFNRRWVKVRLSGPFNHLPTILAQIEPKLQALPIPAHLKTRVKDQLIVSIHDELKTALFLNIPSPFWHHLSSLQIDSAFDALLFALAWTDRETSDLCHVMHFTLTGRFLGIIPLLVLPSLD